MNDNDVTSSKSFAWLFHEFVRNIPEEMDEPNGNTGGLSSSQMAFLLSVIRAKSQAAAKMIDDA